MPDMSKIVAGLQGNALQPLKIYPQAASKDINGLLNDILSDMMTDITLGKLSPSDTDYCKGVFGNAVITNLIDKQAISDLDMLFSNTLRGYSAGKTDYVYLSQALRESHLPEPSSKVVYVVSDVADAAKEYESRRDQQSKTALLANLGAFYNNMRALFLLVDDEDELQRLISVMNPMLKAAGHDEIPATFSLANKIFDGLILRGDYKLMDESCDASSQARIIAQAITTMYPDAIMPTHTIESLLPSVVAIFNASKLARATISELMTVKSDMATMAGLDLSRVISFQKMSSLSQIAKAAQKMQLMQNQLNNTLAQSMKSGKTGRFKIVSIDMSRVKKKIIAAMKKMKNADVSKNPTYHSADTFQRPNRREPLNCDLPGTSTELGYYPDIHLYVDTSGSITQKDYEDSVSMIIDIARTLNCDIYFNSFTTDISQEAVVRCRDRSKTQIQRDIERIPKLTGGTTIDQVWGYINARKKNRRQISILISDFYVDVPRYVRHPAHLFYIPTKDTSVRFAQDFADKLPNPWRVLF